MATVAQELVSYLLIRPGACDTADGISRWWFEAEDGVSPQALKQALDELTGLGLLLACPAADGRVRFRCGADATALQAYLGSAG